MSGTAPPPPYPRVRRLGGRCQEGRNHKRIISLPAGWTEYRPGRRESQTSAIAGGVFYFRRSVCKPCIPFPLVVSLEKRIPSQKCVRPGAALGRQESQVRRLRGPAAVCAGDSLPGCPKVLFLHAIVPLWGAEKAERTGASQKACFCVFPCSSAWKRTGPGPPGSPLRYRFLRALLGPGVFGPCRETLCGVVG